MRLPVIFGMVLSLCCISTGALAQSPVGDLIEQSRQHYLAGELDKSYATIKEAMDQIWEESPLWVGTAVLIEQRSPSYGIYKPRRNNVYAHNEPIMLYLEPKGFGHRKTDNDMWQYGVEVDFVLKQPNGTVMTGQTDLIRAVKESRKKNKELSLSLIYSITGAPPGKYIVETVVRDIVTQQSAAIQNTIVFR